MNFTINTVAKYNLDKVINNHGKKRIYKRYE